VIAGITHRITYKIDKVVIMGIGSPVDLPRVLFIELLAESIRSKQCTASKIPMRVQEPRLCPQDISFLELIRWRLLEWQDEDAERDCLDCNPNNEPAASEITESTLLFMPFLPLDVNVAVLASARPALFIMYPHEKHLHSIERITAEELENFCADFKPKIGEATKDFVSKYRMLIGSYGSMAGLWALRLTGLKRVYIAIVDGFEQMRVLGVYERKPLQ
jgi:hypothetical protein